MKTKIFSLLAAALVLLSVLTGCIKAEADVKVNLLGQISIQILFAIYSESDEPIDIESALPPEYLDALTKNGFTTTSYHQDHFSGILLENKNFDPNNIQKGEEGTGPDISFEPRFAVENGRVVVDLPFESLGSYLAMAASAKPSVEEKGGDIVIRLTAPIKPADHNANKTANGGKTLIWDLTETEDRTSIHFEYSIASFALIWGAILLGSVLVIVVAAVVLVKALKKKKAAHAPEEAV